LNFSRATSLKNRVIKWFNYYLKQEDDFPEKCFEKVEKFFFCVCNNSNLFHIIIKNKKKLNFWCDIYAHLVTLIITGVFQLFLRTRFIIIRGQTRHNPKRYLLHQPVAPQPIWCKFRCKTPEPCTKSIDMKLCQSLQNKYSVNIWNILKLDFWQIKVVRVMASIGRTSLLEHATSSTNLRKKFHTLIGVQSQSKF